MLSSIFFSFCIIQDVALKSEWLIIKVFASIAPFSSSAVSHKCLENKLFHYAKTTKKNPLFLPEHMEHKSPFELQTRLSAAGKTLWTMPIFKNMIQCLLPIAEQKLGSDPVFSFCFFLSILFLADVTACDTGSLTRSANRGECFKVWWPECTELLVQRFSTSASSAAISEKKLSSFQLRRVDSTSACFLQTIKITLSGVLRTQSLRHWKHVSGWQYGQMQQINARREVVNLWVCAAAAAVFSLDLELSKTWVSPVSLKNLMCNFVLEGSRVLKVACLCLIYIPLLKRSTLSAGKP